MPNEIEKLLLELRNLKNNKKNIQNNGNTWAYIRVKDWTGAGFESEEEAKVWISENPYSNI